MCVFSENLRECNMSNHPLSQCAAVITVYSYWERDVYKQESRDVCTLSMVHLPWWQYPA